MDEAAVHKYSMDIVGNCSYLANIDTQASVVWMCMPRFDSPFLFGSLLDRRRGGEFSIGPRGGAGSSEQYYIKNTNILCTRFTCDSGSFIVTDFAPRFFQYDRYFSPLMLVRKIEPLGGQPVINVKCQPVGGNGKEVSGVAMGSNHLRYLNLCAPVRLTTNISLSYIVENKPVLLNETKYLVFTYVTPLEAPIEETCETFLR